MITHDRATTKLTNNAFIRSTYLPNANQINQIKSLFSSKCVVNATDNKNIEEGCQKPKGHQCWPPIAKRIHLIKHCNSYQEKNPKKEIKTHAIDVR
jgi:hypothetical protein